MANTDTTDGQAEGQPGGAEENSYLREGNRLLCLVYDEEDDDYDDDDDDDEEEEEGGGGGGEEGEVDVI